MPGREATAQVLIVEDEFLVALDLEDMLTQAGCRVVGIVPDRSSVAIVPQEPEGAPEVAFVDLNLRDGPTGTAIAAHLAERFGTVIVYVTANPRQIGRPAPTAIGYVQKPYSREAILAALEIARQAECREEGCVIPAEPARLVPGGSLPPELELFPVCRAPG